MKTLFYSLLAGTVLFAGCAKDNIDPPSSTLTGRIVYQDQVLGVRSNSSTNLGSTGNPQPSMLELWQPGYQLFTRIPVYVDQDGTFSATLFDGDYKLVRTRGNGPWVDNTDSIDVQVRGNTVVDVPVEPYFTIQNATFQRSGARVTATCRVNQVVTNRAIDQAVLFISRTQFVDNTNSAARNEKNAADLTNLNNDISFDVAVPTTLQGAVYARIGVRAAGVGEYIYSPVQKIEP